MANDNLSTSMNTNSGISLDIDDTEDNFEEFDEDDWIVSEHKQNFWDENWDENDDVDEDLAKFLNIQNPKKTETDMTQ
ncbi:Sphingomyelin phosphodiesterase D LrSicTox-alphaIB1 [Sarcoptes scabiei]|uniref:Uncharacterized protein n=1 Tax=Sarcoptes scabiei TaxID=52283 RepID=A0A131ZVB3_SARSC|nr:hypothetical protein QR98_0008430 [Sarcoptes scabiei]UXI21536.1 Sphingomyelin phosphodiesterase D LrSicTox-alphaIB1 [Sarcoptes scabiei]